MLKSMDESMTERMHKLLKRLMKRNHARVHFNAPVDWKKYKLLDYPTTIFEPMDLGTVLRKLEEDKHQPYERKNYELAEEFAYDVRQVWKNAFLFNGTPNGSSDRHGVPFGAKELAEDFEQWLVDEYKRSEVLGTPCPLKTRCQLLLSDIRRNPLSEWYRRDDWKMFGPNYIAALSSAEPMDLDQVQVRLFNGYYDVDPPEGGPAVFSAQAFAKDMRLIWKNAMEFNVEGIFWLCPKILGATFDKRFEQLSTAPVPRERGKRREEREGWPSFDRKRDLARKCSRLMAMEGNEVALLIQSKCAEAVTVQDEQGVKQARGRARYACISVVGIACMRGVHVGAVGRRHVRTLHTRTPTCSRADLSGLLTY